MNQTHHLIVGPAILFAPANRPELFAKAAAKADMVILDLEDGAGNCSREQARANIRTSNLDPVRTIVRVCGPTDPGFAEDVAMVRETEYTLVMVPKVYDEIPAELAGFQVIAMVETPQAVVNLAAIAKHPSVVGLFWGAEDLTVLLGGTHSRLQPDEGAPSDRLGPYRDAMRLTRALMHIHSSAEGKFCIDAVHSDFRNPQGMLAEAIDAARSGFAGSACIHPNQVPLVRKAYQPEPGLVEWARKVVAAAAHYPGAFQLEGEMVDAPLISQAHRVLALAEVLAEGEDSAAR